MLDLPDRNLWQIRVVFHVLVELGERARGNRNNFFIKTDLVAHEQNTNDLAAHQRTRKDRRRICNDHIARIAIAGQCMWDKAIIARIPQSKITGMDAT